MDFDLKFEALPVDNVYTVSIKMDPPIWSELGPAMVRTFPHKEISEPVCLPDPANKARTILTLGFFLGPPEMGKLIQLMTPGEKRNEAIRDYGRWQSKIADAQREIAEKKRRAELEKRKD